MNVHPSTPPRQVARAGLSSPDSPGTYPSPRPSRFGLKTYGPMSDSNSIVFGASNQRNRLVRGRGKFEVDVPFELTLPRSDASGSTFSSPSSSLCNSVPQTPTRPSKIKSNDGKGEGKDHSRSHGVNEKRSFFSLKNASMPVLSTFSRSPPPVPVPSPSTSPSPAPRSRPFGLSMFMGGSSSPSASAKTPSPSSSSSSSSPSPPVLTGGKTKTKTLRTPPSVSRLFRVGQGDSATYFEPVLAVRIRRPSVLSIATRSSPKVAWVPLMNPHTDVRADDDEDDEEDAGRSSDEDSSDGEFVSCRKSYEPLISSYAEVGNIGTDRAEEPRLSSSSSEGPLTLAELWALRDSVQEIYVRARSLRVGVEGQTGPSEKDEEEIFSKSVKAAPRVSRKPVPEFFSAIQSKSHSGTRSASHPSIPARRQSLLLPPLERDPSRHLRNMSDESSLASGSSSSSIDDLVSPRTSDSWSLSTLSSPTSETGSMPVTPLASVHTGQVSSFLAPGNDKMYELDVASVFLSTSPSNGPVGLGSSQDEEEDDDEVDQFSISNKGFYQNQAATKSTWAILASKLKSTKKGSSPEKPRFRMGFSKA